MDNDPPYPNLWQVIVMTVICLPVLLAAMIWIVGAAIESFAQHSEDRDRCLRAATNGLEIQRCR